MKLTVKEIVVFGILGTIMYASKVVMELVPNVHLVGVFVIAMTVVYRKKALYPIYIYILLSGLFSGFAVWWIPNLYTWTVLWGITMLLPKDINHRLKPFVYMSVCALHGFLYGTLYAPVHTFFYGLSFNAMLAWIVAGLPWDFVHGVSNFFCGTLICPIIAVLKRSGKYNG